MRHHPVRTTIFLLATLATVAGCEHTVSTVHEAPMTPAAVADKFDTVPTPPVAAQTHFAAGQLAESRGDLDAAEGQYRAAIKLLPDDADALYRLGMILTAERKPDAVSIWQQYVHATGGTAAAYSDLGFALDLAGRPGEAEEAFHKGVLQDPKFEPCRVNYARLLAKRGKWDEAAAQLAAVLTPAEVQFDLGAVSEQEGDRVTAAARYRKALELDPTLNDAKQHLAMVE